MPMLAPSGHEEHSHRDAHDPVERAAKRAWWRSPVTWTFIAFGLVGALFLATAHPEHAWGYLPYALLLLCPILHLFGHRGHGGHGR